MFGLVAEQRLVGWRKLRITEQQTGRLRFLLESGVFLTLVCSRVGWHGPVDDLLRYRLHKYTHRRLHQDLISSYKIIFGLIDIDCSRSSLLPQMKPCADTPTSYLYIIVV